MPYYESDGAARVQWMGPSIDLAKALSVVVSSVRGREWLAVVPHNATPPTLAITIATVNQRNGVIVRSMAGAFGRGSLVPLTKRLRSPVCNTSAKKESAIDC